MKSGYDRIGCIVTVEQATRSCLDKKRYESRNKARDAASKVKRIFPGSKPQRPYSCAICGGFHLTSSIPAGLRQGNNNERKGATS